MLTFLRKIRKSLIESGSTKKYVLYAIDLFFVEVIRDNEKDEIIGIGQFKEGDSLDIYSNISRKI